MPPWGAVKGFGSFRNDQSLSQEQIELVTRWVDGGIRRGNNPRMLPEPRRRPTPGQRAPVAPSITVHGTSRLQRALVLDGVMPEQVPQGGSMHVTAVLPDGRVEPLVWLHGYDDRYPTPLPLSASDPAARRHDDSGRAADAAIGADCPPEARSNPDESVQEFFRERRLPRCLKLARMYAPHDSWRCGEDRCMMSRRYQPAIAVAVLSMLVGAAAAVSAQAPAAQAPMNMANMDHARRHPRDGSRRRPGRSPTPRSPPSTPQRRALRGDDRRAGRVRVRRAAGRQLQRHGRVGRTDRVPPAGRGGYRRPERAARHHAGCGVGAAGRRGRTAGTAPAAGRAQAARHRSRIEHGAVGPGDARASRRSLRR